MTSQEDWNLIKEWDPAKRERALRERGLDFNDAWQILCSLHFVCNVTKPEHRENRYKAVGWLGGQLCSLIYTPRSGKIRIISLRKANPREKEKYHQAVTSFTAR